MANPHTRRWMLRRYPGAVLPLLRLHSWGVAGAGVQGCRDAGVQRYRGTEVWRCVLHPTCRHVAFAPEGFVSGRNGIVYPSRFGFQRIHAYHQMQATGYMLPPAEIRGVMGITGNKEILYRIVSRHRSGVVFAGAAVGSEARSRCQASASLALPASREIRHEESGLTRRACSMSNRFLCATVDRCIPEA